jgi:hypothetical protein
MNSQGDRQMPSVVEKVRKKRQEIWVTEPQEVKDAFLSATGSGDSSFFPCLYGDFEARGCHHALYTIRQTMLNDEVDFKTIKIITNKQLISYLPYLSWPKLHDSEQFFKEIATELMGIRNEEEFIEFLEELTLYVGRLNYWLDQSMPWYEIVQAYDSVMEK